MKAQTQHLVVTSIFKGIPEMPVGSGQSSSLVGRQPIEIADVAGVGVVMLPDDRHPSFWWFR